MWRHLVFHNISFRQCGAQIIERQISLDHFAVTPANDGDMFLSAALVLFCHKPPSNTSFLAVVTYHTSRPLLRKELVCLSFATNKIISMKLPLTDKKELKTQIRIRYVYEGPSARGRNTTKSTCQLECRAIQKYRSNARKVLLPPTRLFTNKRLYKIC